MANQSSALRTLKCSVSLGLFVSSRIRDFSLRLIGGKPKGSCVILYYHSVPSDGRGRFARQLDTLLQLTKPISLGGGFPLEAGVRYAGITFDDGFEDFVDVALPELVKRTIPVTVFVLAGALGKTFGPHGEGKRVMSARQVVDLPSHLVTIGSHTLTHPFLPSLSEREAQFEIAQSRTQIEHMLNRPVLLFSFPFGGFNERLVELCREAGYERVFTTLPGFAFENPDEFVVGRVRVDPGDWPLEFRLKLAGAYHWLPWAFALKRRLRSNPLTRWIWDHVVKGSTGRRSVIQESNSL